MTLPMSLRKNLGINGKQQFVVSATETGEIILKPAITLPLELYTEERIAEFSDDDKAIGDLMKKHGIK